MVFQIKLSVLFFILIASPITLANEAFTPQFIEGTTRVSAEEIVTLVEKHENIVVIDSRTKNEIVKGYIEGSINLTYTDTYGATLARYIKNSDTPVVFYCSDIKCNQSVKAAKIAAAEGYSSVYWFRGGLKEWQKKGLPIVRP